MTSLKDVKNDLTATDLITAMRNNLICEKDTHKMIEALKNVAKTPQELGFVEALNKGCSINELDKKTAQELARFHNNHSFRTIKPTTKPLIPSDNLDDGRQTALDDITKELDEYKPLPSNVKLKVTARIDKP